MSFHFPPVSFSLEVLPCRSPCPLATDVLSKKKSESCFGDRLSVVLYPAPHRTPSVFLSCWFKKIYIFYLELGCQEKGMKNQQRLNQIQSCLWGFPFKHLKKSIWVAEEWDQTVPSHFWSCQFKVPMEWRERDGGAVVGSYRHLALTFRLHSCPLKLGLFSLNRSEARRRATVWLTTNPRGIFIRHSLHCRTTNGFNSSN